MRKVHNFYDYSNLTMDVYNFAIKYWEDAKPNVRVQRIYEVPFSSLALFRVIINGISTTIARTNEIINDLEDEKNREEYLQKIDKFVGELTCFSKIKTYKNLSNDEKRQQLKNCLAHSNFKIIEDTEKTTVNERYAILIENDYLSVEISLIELEQLKTFYVSLSDEMDYNKKTYAGLLDFLTFTINSNNILDGAVEKIGVINLEKDDASKTLAKNITMMHYDTPEGTVSLNQEDKDIIKNFIKYIGINNWICLDKKVRASFFARQIKFLLDSKIDLRMNVEYVSSLVRFLLSKGENREMIEYYKFESPMVYVSNILDMAYFCFNYLREAHKKEALGEFDFKDFPLTGITLDEKYKEFIKKVDEPARIKAELNHKQRLYQKLSRDIAKEEQLKNGIIIANMDETKRSELLEYKNEKIKSKHEDLKECSLVIQELTTALSEAKVYYDSSNFFRHLRNSLAHGFYSVDYSKGLKSKDLGKIEFTFYDYDINPENRKDRVKLFEVKMTAVRLVRLLNDFSERIKSNMDLAYLDSPEIYVSVSKNKELQELMNSHLQEYEDQGATIKKL